MFYRGFEVKQAKTGLWQAVRPTDFSWLDGIAADDRYALKDAIDAYWATQKPDPWALPAKSKALVLA